MSKVAVAAFVVAIVGAGIGSPIRAQTTGRIATTIEAAIAEPVFFHGRQIAIRAATVQDRGGTRIVAGSPGPTDKPKLHPVFVFWQQTPSRTDGEIRGEFFDLGRLREDDSRFSSYDFRPLLEAVAGGRWPSRDEVFVVVGATVVDAPEASAPSVRAIVLQPAKFADRGVTVTGRFRGRNLFGDVASALNRSRWDFVVQSADAAIWVSALRPRGTGFELDPGARVDTGRWVEVSGTVHVEGSRVWIDGESLRIAKPPTETDAEPAPMPVIKEPAPTVIFTAPLTEDVDVATDTTVRLQFSRDMDGRTFRGQVRVSYVATNPAAPPPPIPAPTITYHEANRALEIKFGGPLGRFQTIKVELMDGIGAMDGQKLVPWSMTFSTGAK